MAAEIACLQGPSLSGPVFDLRTGSTWNLPTKQMGRLIPDIHYPSTMTPLPDRMFLIIYKLLQILVSFSP